MLIPESGEGLQEERKELHAGLLERDHGSGTGAVARNPVCTKHLRCCPVLEGESNVKSVSVGDSDEMIASKGSVM